MMWNPKPTRRDFLHAMGVATGAGSLAVVGCNGQPDPTPTPTDPDPTDPGPGVTRRDVTSAEAANALESYKEAVRAMKLLDPSNPISWAAQAQIHLDFCPHGNAFFLPWHRGYLHYFEEIIRGVLNDQSFALPYWNWTTQPSIPDPFWQEPLNATRGIRQGEEIPARFVGQNVINGILSIGDFETFGSRYVTNACASDPFQRSRCGTGELEGVPHNNVHGRIGGIMGTFRSPLDPIFWLHHCNVDRLWVEWNKTHANGNFAPWRDFDFADNFVNAQGVSQSIKVLDTFSTTALGYVYDTQGAVSAIAPLGASGTVVASVSAENSAAAVPERSLGISVPLSPEVLEGLRGVASVGAVAGVGGRKTIRLVLAGVPTPQQPLGVHVYVGAADAPASPDSPHYVRTFGFFPTGEEHAGHGGGPTTFLFDIGDDLARLGGQTGDTLSVHVQSVPLYQGAEAITEAVAPTSVQVEVVEIS